MQVATRPVSIVGGGVLALVVAGVALAGPAAAVDHAARPDVRVTHGPSCRPGGVVVEVAGGTVGHAVTLATTRAPGGEDTAEVAPGAVVVLATGEVDWGETIDPFLEIRALDGSGAAWVDELPGYSFTRPAEEDCAAIAPPTGAAAVPPMGEVVPGLPGPDGSVPAGTTPGSPPVDVSTRVVAAVDDAGPGWPLLAGGGALVATGAGLAVVAGARRAGSRPRGSSSPGSA
ncbi:hypothetical protein [Geodermatophilus sp. DSM 45219]|uniref:hypothetical protein n=1 Tax=Geodermatophilus sp. DSM 45219 TaxID=1881103 RepID=UPI0008808305|nr:hypothetical protein [Geodermatophilus sp. DSM 45219]SDN54326.1 hypothetical protein SAMN05428965_0863 [Geodermatophilus sp. DSM 45219]